MLSVLLTIIGLLIAIPSCVTAIISLIEHSQKEAERREAWALGKWTNEGDINAEEPIYIHVDFDKANHRVAGLGLYGTLESPQLHQIYYIRAFKKSIFKPWTGVIYVAVGWREIPLISIQIRADVRNDTLRIVKIKKEGHIDDSEDFFEKLKKETKLWHE